MHMLQGDLAANIVAGTVSGVVQPVLFNGVDAFRVRWQVEGSRSSQTLASFTRAILTHEGYWRGLHLRGLHWNVAAVGVAQGIRFGLYPTVR